jgi:LPS-assembly protein
VNKKKSSIKYLFYYLFVIYSIQMIIYKNSIYAQSILGSSQIPNLVWYDANNMIINKNTATFTLDGNAIILIGKIYLSANKIIIQKDIGLITAEGNVNLINNKQKAIASRIVFDTNTKQLRMDNAQIFSDPNLSEDVVSEETLGLSKAEIAFEKAKETRTKEIENELKSIREEYSKLQNLKSIKKYNSSDLNSQSNELTKKYSRLLARLARTQFQPNAILAALPEKERDKLLERRQAVERFNRENPQIANQIANFSAIKGYVKVAASQILQKDTDTLILNNAIVTPCNCSSFNEPPIYGFSTQNANIEVDNYITMRDVTFDVFSIPIFYSPWLKFPIKSKRETGFLTPNSYMSNNAGSATSIPFFIVLGPYADSTITYEYFSQRGSQFSGDFRLQLEKDSQFKTEAKYIKDKTYQNAWAANSSNVDQAVATAPNPATASMYNGFRGSNLENRWSSASSINVPLMERLSIKTNAQFVSDNTYLSDYSNNNASISPDAAVYGDTSSASKRFLSQEVDAEYYGDNIILSVRAQGTKDLFAPDQTTTPNRMPRIEFSLLPDRYFDTPFLFSNNTTWENIYRPNGQNFIPVAQNVFSPQASQGSIVPQTGSYLPGGQKNPNDPYAKGNRAFTSSTLSIPLAANDYVNANLSTTAVGTQYYFPDSYPYNNVQPYMGYLQHKAHLDLPLYATLKLNNPNNSGIGSITQNFTPSIDINYIPAVTRSSNFPNTYQLWYAQDNVVSISTVTLGATTSWTIQKEEFIESKEPISRLPPSEEPGVANLNFFSESVKENNLNVFPDSKGIFQFSSDSEASEVFDLWAKKELDNYYEKITENEFRQNYVWPKGNFYSKQISWKMTPLSLTVSTGYNLLADKTADETNANAGPTIAPIPSQRYTNINGSATVNLNPLVPFQTTFSSSYNQYYHRIDSLGGSVNATLPYGLDISYSNSQQFSVDPTNSQANSFIKKTQQTATVAYTPVTWLQFKYQWSENTDPTSTTDLSNGRAYGSSQNVTFLNLQDCLDISLARNKAAGYSEGQATYVISVNFRFFGYSYSSPQLGDYINRNLQN